MSRQDRQAGFSLVELAISLMVIGLLIGGVLKGKELMENAKVSSMVMEFKTLETATNTFKKIYGNLPGDMLWAWTRLPNCTLDSCYGIGNGDGIISVNQTTAVIDHGSGGSTTESKTFWPQLSVSGLIPGVIDMSMLGNSGRTPGGDFPKTPFANSMVVVHYWSMTSDPAFGTFSNHFFKTGRPDLTDVSGSLTASQAAKVDRKMDDGKPESGNILGRSGSTGSCILSGGNRIYPESDPRAMCDLAYRTNF